MLDSMSGKTFMSWYWYSLIEPFGDQAANWRAASIREMVHNTRVEKKYQRPVKDFLLEFVVKDSVPEGESYVKTKEYVQTIDTETALKMMMGIPLDLGKK